MRFELWLILVVNQILSLISVYSLIQYERSLFLPMICVGWFICILGFDKMRPILGKLNKCVFILVVVEVLSLVLLLVYSHVKYDEISYEPYYVSLIIINGFLLKFSKLEKP